MTVKYMIKLFMKKILVGLMMVGWLIVGGEVWAAGFNLQNIGSVATGGRQSSHWWYTGSNPVLRGEAAPGEAVTIETDGTAILINADSSGNWNYQLPAMTDGDHSIKLNNGSGSVISFTLTIGVNGVNWDAVSKGSAETLPTVGTTWPTVLALILGLGMAGWGGKMFNASKE